MPTTIDNIRLLYSSAATDICEELTNGSTSLITVNEFIEKIILKGEIIRDDYFNLNCRVCDFIVYTDSECIFPNENYLLISVLELKTSYVDPDKIKEQLQNGALFSETIFQNCNNGNLCKFYPILVLDRLRDNCIDLIYTTRIYYGGIRYSLIPVEGSNELSNIIRDFHNNSR